MILLRLRRFSGFIDPFSISKIFTRSKNILQVLEQFEFQKSVFTAKDHAIPLISSIKRLKNDVDLPNALRDARFRDFLKILNAEENPDVYIDVIYELGILYKMTNTEVHAEVLEKFLEFIDSALEKLSIKSAAKCLYSISLLLPPTAENIKLGKRLVEHIVKLLETSIPSEQDCLRIVTACRDL